MEREPAVELEYLQRMLADIRRDHRYGASREVIDAAARLGEFSDAGSSRGQGVACRGGVAPTPALASRAFWPGWP
jgi:hypothetical protein